MPNHLEHYTLLFSGLYIIALISIAWIACRNEPKSQQAFIIGNRNIGTIGTLSSLVAGQFSGAIIFIFFAMAPKIGYGLLWMPLGATAGLMLLTCHLKSVHSNASKHNYVTLTDLLEKRIGQNTGKLTTLIISLKSLLLITSQLFIAGNIFATIFDIPPLWSIMGISFCITTYLWLGGYLSVIHTDILQVILLLITIIIPVFSLHTPTDHNILSDIQNLNETSVGLFIFIALMVYSNAEMWQRMFSIKDYKTGIKGFKLAGPTLILLVFFTITLVLTAHNNLQNETMGNAAFFEVFHQTTLPPLFLSLLCVFSISAIMSTIDTQTHLLTSTITKNILKVNEKNKHQYFVKLSRIITVITLLSLGIIAATIGDILEFIFKAASISFVIIPALLLSNTSFIKKHSLHDKKMTTSILIGLIIYSYMFFNGHFSHPINTILPPLITLGSFTILRHPSFTRKF